MESESKSPSSDPHSQANAVAAWRWPTVVVVLALMVLVAYIVSIKTAKDAATGTIQETRKTIAEIRAKQRSGLPLLPTPRMR